MQTTTPNHAVVRHYRKTRRIPMPESFAERESLKRPRISPVTWALIATVAWVALVSAGLTVGSWFAHK